jgi:elongator complex protein 3
VPFAVDYRDVDGGVDGRRVGESYNRLVRAFTSSRSAASRLERQQQAGWSELAEVERRNETGRVRCVGLVLETRPDHLDEAEVERLRRLGATKVQIGVQSLDDRVLAANRRGHDTAATRRAFALLRRAGFKIHAHWMANLYGSTPERDVEDYRRLFADPDFRPDELKLYPCSLIESAELMQHWESGAWRPYTHDELLDVVAACLLATPEYCRLTRVIRDIPGTDIVDGNRLTNFRQLAEEEVARRGRAVCDVRAREVRGMAVRPDELRLRSLDYQASTGRERFLQLVTPEDRLAAFLRLRLPPDDRAAAVPELRGSAIVREVHVYGSLVGLGERRSAASQHLGLGRRLVETAAGMAAAAGYRDLAVISAVGTRRYYRRLGFRDGALYQHRPLVAPAD